MSSLVKAEAVTLLSALESTLGVQPTTGWRQHQPNPGGIANYYPQVKKVARSPLSKNRQNEKGDIVDLDAVPAITHDVNKDLLDAFNEGILLSATKHTGGTGLAYFTPSAVSSTVYTVAALGALAQNTLIYARGFTVAGNNGLKVVGAASSGTTIPTGGLATETVSGYLATVEVAGWRGASGDIGIDVNGNLTSSVADFTTMGLLAGMVIWVGGTIGGANAFGTAAYRGFAQIVTVAAHLVTLKLRQWTIGAADTGVAKLIDIYWGRWFRNVAFDHADYKEPSYTTELSLPGAAAAGATDYMYANGCMVDTFEISAPKLSLLTSTITFAGTTIGNPTTVRATGAATGNLPLATNAFNVVTEELFLKVQNTSDEVAVLIDIDNWKFTLQNNITPQKQQGTFGAIRMIVGKCVVAVDIGGFLVQDDGMQAIRDKRTMRFGAGLRNGDGGFFVDVPALTFEGGAPSFPANGPVMYSPKAVAFRDTNFSFTFGLTQYPYLPSA